MARHGRVSGFRSFSAAFALLVASGAVDLPRALAQPLEQKTPEATTAESAETAPSGAAEFVLIRADQQSYDRQLGRALASGNVEVVIRGWRLWADQLEYAESSRSVRASGRVRLQRGDQYLQASSLRYSDWEGSGELLDVYGVIDRDTLPGAVRAGSDTNQAPGAETTARPDFVCPPLVAHPQQSSALHLLPPGRQPLPTIAAPQGCAGADSSRAPRSLRERLNEVALGPGPTPTPAPPAAASTPPAPTQNVRDVRFQQSLDTSIKLDLAAVIDTVDTENNSPAGGRFRPSKGPKGSITRIRFQSSRLTMQGDRWTAAEVAFTNDPFTPANSWTIARQVTAVLDRPSGVTRINAGSSRIVLDQRLSIPAITSSTIGEDEIPVVIDADKQDRDGVYLGYNLPQIRFGEKGRLKLQPQFLVQRTLEGKTSSYIEPGKGLGSPTVEQSMKAGDAFGLDALLDVPFAGMQLNADLSISTFNPDNFASGTRSIASLSKPLGLSWAPSATASLFGGYRERIYNGSLGLQNLIWSYGGRLSGSSTIQLAGPPRAHATSTADEQTHHAPEEPTLTGRQTPYFQPLEISWVAQSGNYQANLFDSEQLTTLWRTNLNLQAGTSLRLWEGGQRYSGEGIEGLRFAAIPVVPGFGLDMGISGTISYYDNGSDQNTLSLWGGPSLTLGQFEKPWFDYTRLAVAVGGTLRSGLSPFGFDRAVDLRTISFNAAQQIYGPLVVEGGASFNIDPDSEFYGDASYSYIEVKLQRRSYEIGVYYSPYDGIGGIRLKLNDFNFIGVGSPFVPRPASAKESVLPSGRPGSS
jgi:lipopolysaccharide export system protein LptA